MADPFESTHTGTVVDTAVTDITALVGSGTAKNIKAAAITGTTLNLTGAAVTTISSGVDAVQTVSSGSAGYFLNVRDNGSGRMALGNTNNSGGTNNIIDIGFGNAGAGVTTTSVLKLYQDQSADFLGTLDVAGAVSKGSGSFKISHPLPELTDTHQLVHSFTESPQADLLYSGTTELANGKAEINLDEYHGMTEGTFVALNRNIRVFTTNESDWEPIKGYVVGNILHISCQDAANSDSVSWLVIGERHDQHMYDTGWTDDEGRVIVEPLKRLPEPTPEPVQRTVQVPIMDGDEQVTEMETVAVKERIEFIDGVATLIPATWDRQLVPQFYTVGVFDTDGNPVYA